MPHPRPRTEVETLLSYLNGQRDHALGILEGLDADALRRPVLPSGWSCLGMVAHLAALERFWFRAVVAGDPAAADAPHGDPPEWRVPASAGFAAYRREAAATDGVVRTASLDAAPAWWPGDLFGDWRLDSVREVVLHALTETANHAGHLDAARGLIDGRLRLLLDA